MPQIPIQHTQIQPSSVSVPRVPMDIKGPSLVAKVGSALVDFGQKMDKARESSQLAQAETEWKEGILEFKNSLDNDTDYATYEKRFDDYSATLHKQASDKINHKGAKKTFDFIANDSSIVEKAKIKHQANQVEIRFMEADYFKQLNSAVKREDRDFIISATSNAIEGGYVDPIVGEKAKIAALEKLNYTSAWNDIVDVQERDEVQAVLKDAKISSSEKSSLMSFWDREQTHKTAQAKTDKARTITEIQDNFVGRIDELTPSEIQQSGLPPVGSGSKLFFLNLLEQRNKAVVEEEADPYTTTNGALLAQLLMRNADPEQPALSTAEILEYIPEEDGLSLTTAQALVKSTNVLSTPVFKNTEAALKHQFGYEGLLTGFGSKQLGSIYYNNAMSEILKELAKSPLKGMELRNKMQEIAAPHLEQYMIEYGESPDTIDKKLRLMGAKTSPTLKIVAPPKTDKKTLRWIPGKGWSE